MTNSRTSMPGHEAENAGRETHELHEYAGGYIKAREGVIPVWLLVLYFGLFAWACYYLVHYWGGLGPGRIE
jgi:hypothetical protein